MKQIEFKQKDKPAITVGEDDLIANMVDYLRHHFPKEECVVVERMANGREITEGAAAVFLLLKNPQLVNHYNKLIER